MGRGLFAVAAVVAATLAACGGGDDDRPDRTIAFVRSSSVGAEGQAAFLAALDDAGWEEGENLTILNGDPASGFDDPDAAVAAVEGFVEDGADLIVALSTSAAMAATEATSEIPILTLANDPVGSGIVENPRTPEANVTGVSFRVPADRTLDLAQQLAPGLPVGVLSASDDPGGQPIIAGIRDAAAAIDVEIVEASFTGEDPVDVEAAVGELDAAGVGITVIANSAGTARVLPTIEMATGAAGMPVVANTDSNTFAVVVLAPDNEEAYRQLARQAIRVLDDTEIADIPLEDPGTFNLTVRRNIAARLDLALPDAVLDQADTVSG